MLNRFQIASILIDKHYSESFLKSDNLNTYVRIHALDFEDMLDSIRKHIGDLPDVLPSQEAYGFFREHIAKTKDHMLISKAPSIGFRYLRKNENLSVEQLTELIHQGEGYAKDVSWAIATIAHERSDQSCAMSSPLNWDGGTELFKLYECEINSENNFLAQKFIDYLVVNGHDIETIIGAILNASVRNISKTKVIKLYWGLVPMMVALIFGLISRTPLLRTYSSSVNGIERATRSA